LDAAWRRRWSKLFDAVDDEFESDLFDELKNGWVGFVESK
jgi:hypothetical protein